MADFTPDQTPFVPVWLDDYNVAPPPPAQGFVPGIGVPAEQFDQAAAQAAAVQPMPAEQPVEPAPMVPMQPGLGIPAPVFDQALAAPPVAEPAPVQAMDPSGHAAQPMDPYADLVGQNPLDNPNLSQDDANKAVAHIFQTDPYLAAEIQQKHELAQQNFAATEALRISAEDRRRAEENHHTQVEATARANAYSERLMAEAAAIGNTKIDTGRWFSNRTTGQKIAMALGAIGGGVVAGTPGSGGKNPFIEGMQHDIEQDIQAQQHDIANGMASVNARRGLVAEIYQRTGDLYQAGEVARVAMLTSSRNDLAARMQLFDPRGTTALGYAKAISDVDGRIMAAQQKAVKDEYERQKMLLEMDKMRADTAKTRAETAAKLAKGGAAKPKVVMTKGVFAHKNGITSWGDAEEAMYQQYLAGQAQSAGGSAAPASASSAPAVTFPQGAPAAGRPSNPSPSSPAAPATATPATGTQQPITAPAQVDQTKPKTYKNKDSWFSDNLPTARPEDKKRFWFVDGKNGSEVPPVELEGGIDPEKFIEKQRIRREMATKADQLRVLTERLEGKGAWSTAKNSFKWASDDDAVEARALWQDLVGLAIQAKGMGVPSGNDVERVYQMQGGDPAGWLKSLPALQRARESLQIEQDADWATAAPSSANNPAYNRYRQLPTASPDWLKKLEGRGAVKTVEPEEGNTDPKQIRGRSFAGDAPNEEQAKTDVQAKRRQSIASSYLESSGAVAAQDFDTPDELTLNKASRPADQLNPQARDYKYQGPPATADAWKRLRDLHASNVAVANRLTRKPDDGDWNALQKGEAEANHELVRVLRGNPQLLDRYSKYFQPPADSPPEVRTILFDKALETMSPELLARITGEVLRSGGK